MPVRVSVRVCVCLAPAAPPGKHRCCLRAGERQQSAVPAGSMFDLRNVVIVLCMCVSFMTATRSTAAITGNAYSAHDLW